TRAELEKLAELLDGTDTLIVSDEAYSALTYTSERFTSALEVDGLQERTLYVQTFSKKYCMTGFRVGYVAGAKTSSLLLRNCTARSTALYQSKRSWLRLPLFLYQNQ